MHLQTCKQLKPSNYLHQLLWWTQSSHRLKQQPHRHTWQRGAGAQRVSQQGRCCSTGLGLSAPQA